MLCFANVYHETTLFQLGRGVHSTDFKKARKRVVFSCVDVGESIMQQENELYKKGSFITHVNTSNLHSGDPTTL